MKRTLVLADTHRKVRRAREIVRRCMPLDGLVHLGDCVEDAYELRDAFGLNLWAVSGNHDGYGREPGEPAFEIEGVRIFACHGDRYDLTACCQDGEWDGNLAALLRRAEASRCDGVLFGDRHVARREFRGRVLILNAGSACQGERDAGYGMLEITGGRVRGSLHRIPQERTLLHPCA